MSRVEAQELLSLRVAKRLICMDTRDMIARDPNKGIICRSALKLFCAKGIWHVAHEFRSRVQPSSKSNDTSTCVERLRLRDEQLRCNTRFVSAAVRAFQVKASRLEDLFHSFFTMACAWKKGFCGDSPMAELFRLAEGLFHERSGHWGVGVSPGLVGRLEGACV